MPWRRVFSTWMFILLGAGATGIGMGLVLVNARAERDALKEQVHSGQSQILSLQTEHTRLMAEASARVTSAEKAERETREKLDSLTSSQQLLAISPTLPAPDPRIKRGWVETISVPLGISLRTPAFAPAATTEQSITATINGTAQTAGDLWLSITRYSSDGERSLLGQLLATTTARYRLGNKILVGTRGTFQNNQGIAFIFRIEQNGHPENLLWMRTIAPLTESRLLEILSTLTFAS